MKKTVITMIFMIMSISSIFGQSYNEGFENGMPNGWKSHGVEISREKHKSGSKSAKFNNTKDTIISTPFEFNNLQLYIYTSDKDQSIKINGVVFSLERDHWKKVDVEGNGINILTIISNSLNPIYVDDISNDNPLPIKLQSFNSTVNINNVNLTWKTESEINNSKFEVYRNEIKIGEVNGNGTTNNISTYIFEDNNLQSGQYLYKLKQIDYNGNFEWFNLSSVINIINPNKSNVIQNYPNPFNPTTKINYTVGKDGLVTIKVYDMSGKQLVILVNEYKTSGYYSVDFNGNNLSSGNYIYVYETNGIQITKKMTLIK